MRKYFLLRVESGGFGYFPSNFEVSILFDFFFVLFLPNDFIFNKLFKTILFQGCLFLQLIVV